VEGLGVDLYARTGGSEFVEAVTLR
jgi:hypothetical protein